jgi:hypothetical protein
MKKGFYGRSEEHSLAARGVQIKIKAKGYPDKIVYTGGNEVASMIVQTDYQIKLLMNTNTTPQQIGFPEGYSKEKAIRMLKVNKQNDIKQLKLILNETAKQKGVYNQNVKQTYNIQLSDGTILNI